MSPSPLLSAEVWRFPKELGPGIQGLDDREMKPCNEAKIKQEEKEKQPRLGIATDYDK